MGRAGDEKQVISLQWPNVSFLSFKSKNVAQCRFPHIFVSAVASDERIKLENTKVSTCNLTRHLLVGMVFRLLLPRGLSESTLTVCSCVALYPVRLCTVCLYLL